MKPSRSPFRQHRALAVLAPLPILLCACTSLVVATPGDSPERVAASFVSFVGAEKPEDAAALLFSSPQRPLTVATDDIDAVRRLAGMDAGCSLRPGWEAHTNVVERADRYLVTVPLACGDRDTDSSVDIAVTKGDDHWVLWD